MKVGVAVAGGTKASAEERLRAGFASQKAGVENVFPKTTRVGCDWASSQRVKLYVQPMENGREQREKRVQQSREARYHQIKQSHFWQCGGSEEAIVGSGAKLVEGQDNKTKLSVILVIGSVEGGRNEAIVGSGDKFVECEGREEVSWDLVTQ